MSADTERSGHVLAGKYRLIRAVSEGAREVWEARHEAIAGRVALKLWPLTTPWDAFRRGAERATTLRHPGVMQVLDFNVEPGRAPFLALEWVDGRRLSDIIAEVGLMPLERVAPLVESAAWALASAHQQGVVHQELRPDEVFVVQAPGTTREWVKLAGFGVSAALARAGARPPSKYRAPEQRAPKDTLGDGDTTGVDGDDPQSDQYALAAIAYEMLAGVPPFDDAASKAEPLPLSDLAPGVSAAVDAAIRQALSIEPEQRFAGVLEFARALRAGAEGASPEAVRKGAGTTREKETVSPFFNPLSPLLPLQTAGEALRRVASGTARLQALNTPRTAPMMRLAFVAVVLALAVVFVGVGVKRHRRVETPAPVAVATPTPTPSATPAPAPPPESPPPKPVAAADASAAAPPEEETPEEETPEEETPDEETPAAKARSEAWAKLAASEAARPARKASAARVAAAKPETAKNEPAKAATTASASCVMSVGSRPTADVLIDDKSVGRRTPLVSYHLACGDHKLVLRRSDLDLYQMEMITLRAGAPFKKVYPLQ